ncbi:MAG: serine hydrolase domain-containing protein [Candidatus Hodarchaeota archaeon]
MMTNNSSNLRNPSLAMILTFLLFFPTIGSIIGISAHTFGTDDSRDYWPTISWRTSTPETQGMDSTMLNQMLEYIGEQGYNIDSIMVIRNGYIVLEEYTNPSYNQITKHVCYSVTKSFTSALIGIAIQKGFINNIDQKVVDFFPDKTIANLDIRKQSMTIEHLLTMSTGLEWDESTFPYMDLEDNPVLQNSYIQLIYSNDSIQFVLDQPMINDPGVKWVYNSGASHLLSTIIEYITGYSTLNFAHEFLFGPLGISDVSWTQHSQGLYYGAHGLYLRPQDMAKFGYLYLNNGSWDDKHVVSADWVIKSTQTYIWPRKEVGYGYQWWTLPLDGIYFASGLYGQGIFVIPEYDLVVVFTAEIKKRMNPELSMLFEYIIPAVVGDPSPQTNFAKLPTSVLIALTVPLVVVSVYLIIRMIKKRI